MSRESQTPLQALVAVGDSDAARSLSVALARLDIHARCVGDAAGALGEVLDRRYDLVLLDESTATIGGLLTLRFIRAHQRSAGEARSPVLMVGGDPEAAVAVDGHVPLPVSLPALERLLKGLPDDLPRERPPEVGEADAEFDGGFLSLVQASEDVVRVLDPLGRVEFMNTRGQELLGITDFARNRGVYWPLLWPETTRPGLERALATALLGGIGRFEGYCPTAVGHDRWWNTVISPVYGADGKVARALAVSRDLTDQRRMQEALFAALAEAEAANRARSDFFANVSHELRTPLNSIIGMASLLGETTLSGDQASMLEVVAEAGEALATRLGDILDHSRMGAGRLEPAAEPFHLGDLLREAAAEAGATAAARNLEFRLVLNSSVETRVTGDPGRLRKIVGHLLSNAVKFTDQGSVTLSATLRDGGMCRIRVVDTGVGIHPSAQESIFRQGDGSNTRRHGGLGLGLALSRQLAELLGATLGCRSAEGRGATFTLVIPLPPVVDEATSDAFGEPGSPGAASVLVVDDHPANREVLKLILAQIGADVITAEDGAQACDLFETSGFDLVVMDVQMPVMDGPTAVRHMRARESADGRRRTPIAMFTACATDEARADSQAAGADRFLCKPLEPAALIMAFRDLLGAEPPEGSDRVGARPS